MREIKFRYWDTEGGMIYQESSETFNPDYISAFFQNVYFDSHVMQYTGLKDKNGQEIYEGDILQTSFEIRDNFESPIPIHQSAVIFSTKQAAFCTKWNFLDYLIDECDSEVIGNIYETPELLEDK